MSESANPTPPQRKRRPRVAARAIVWHRDHLLLLRGEDPGRTWYFLPGGHVDQGERMQEACAREVLEETGIHVVVERPLYLREFIAARHRRRTKGMPEHHHVYAMLFLARPDPAHYGDDPQLDALGEAPAQIDAAPSVKGLRWVHRDQVAELELMPPHLKRALVGDFPPPPSSGVEFWGEDAH